MSLRVAILYNDDGGLARGEAADRFAVQAVLGAAASVEPGWSIGSVSSR